MRTANASLKSSKATEPFPAETEGAPGMTCHSERRGAKRGIGFSSRAAKRIGLNGEGRKRAGLLIGLASLMVLFGSCSRDPSVAKQKYLDSGNRYFDKGQYRSAAIQYQNAIRVDPSFEDGHARLAQAYLKLGMWSAAPTRELTRAVDENPNDLPLRR